MKVILFGATGMVGQGALRECLLDPDIELVQIIGRTPSGTKHAKVVELLTDNMWDYIALEPKLSGFDACLFCLGTPSAGKTEEAYRKVTYDLTMAAAEALCRLNPKMTFVYVSGEGADSSEKGSVMWARVRGALENALLRLPFKAVYIFRPGVIQPLHGIKSKTPTYRLFYSLAKPLLPLARFAFPNQISTTEILGRALIAAAKRGADKTLLKTADFNKLGALAKSRTGK